MKAAQRGVVEAQFSVGVCYSKGEGVEANPSEAFRWYIRAAKMGHEDAAHNVAHFYKIGCGTKTNERKAAYWYHRADMLKRKNPRIGPR